MLIVKLQDSVCKFPKSNTPPWAFFTFLKLFNRCKASHVLPVGLDDVSLEISLCLHLEGNHPEQMFLNGKILKFVCEGVYFTR